MVKFGYTIHYVSCVTDTLGFFEKAFKMKRRFVTEEQDYGELETGETVLAFATHVLGKTNLSGGYISTTDSGLPLGVEIALVTEDVNVAHLNALENGATELKKPERKPWGQVVSYVRSPYQYHTVLPDLTA
jgi:lactoylglutathione lyase